MLYDYLSVIATPVADGFERSRLRTGADKIRGAHAPVSVSKDQCTLGSHKLFRNTLFWIILFFLLSA